MKAKKFLVILCLLAVALLAVACGEEETTTAEPVVTTTAEATTTAATTTEATTTAATTTAAATTTKATTKATTAAATTTTAATTAAPAPVAPADPYLWNGNVATAFAGGTGTAEDPYQIANGAQLALMAETFEKGAYYILVDDIMLNDVYNFDAWGTGALRPLNPWTPIEGFNANFDGKGKTIYGLYGIPLFKTTKDATISNIGIAYADVEDALLIGTATDTNIAGITFVKDTTFVDGDVITLPENATADDIINALVSERLITLGENPEVWGFEALAVGALATDLYDANDKLGTSFNVTIVDGKGYTEEEEPVSNKALAWDANDANANTIVLNITKDASALTNWSGADEVLVYIDGTEQAGAYEFGISLIDAAGKTWTVAAGKDVATLDGYAWASFKATGANFALADGYKGWVRVPFASFVDADGKALNAANVNVAKIALTYKNASAVDAGTFYVDSIRILDADGAWKVVPNTLPTLNPAYGVTVIETFGANTTATGRIPDNHAGNGLTSIEGGEFLLTAPKNAGPDFYVDLNKDIAADLQGFLVYIDLDKVVLQSENRADGLMKAIYLGLRFNIDGKAYCAGGTYYQSKSNPKNHIQQNETYIQNANGEWVKLYNQNNNRLVLPTAAEGTDYFTGWMFVPTANLSHNGHNEAFLDDYLATKDNVKLENLLFYSSNLGKDSVVAIDQIIAVNGTVAEVTPEALPEDAPATLPNDVDYQISGTIDFNNADDFFHVREGGALVAGAGKDETGAYTLIANANGSRIDRTITTAKGKNLIAGMKDSGFMMYVDLTNMTPAEGKETVGFGIGVAMSYDEQYRNDSATAENKYSGIATDNGSYWNFQLAKTKTAIGYIQNADGEWVEVYNQTDNYYFDMPAGYVGYLYVPFGALHRNGNNRELDNLYNNGNGVGNYPYLRFIRVYTAGASNEGAYAIMDDFSVVEATEGFYDNVATAPETYMPAKLPEGVDYQAANKIALESADEFVAIGVGNNCTYSFGTTSAVKGNALTFSPNGSGRAELYMVIPEQSLQGVKGFLYHIDFSKAVAKKNEDGSLADMATTLTINVNDHRAHTGPDANQKAFLLADGTTEWVETMSIAGKINSNDRFAVPANFCGWVYIPLNTYGGDGGLWNPYTGIGTGWINVEDFRIYTDGYDYTTDTKITIDEIIYVK